MITDRNLKGGERLVARHKGEDYTCTVKSTKDGLRFVLADGQEFKSPSSAASAVMGGSAANGWRFWSLEGELKPKPEPRQAKTAKVDLVIKPMRGAEGRFWCSACQDAFASDEENPTCPKGHSNAATVEAPEATKTAKKASAKQPKKTPAKRKSTAKAKA